MPPTYSVGQMTLFGQAEVVAFGDDSFRIEVVPRDIANRIIKANHYSGKVFGLSSEHHGVYIDGALVGILQWGPGMNPASGGGVVEGTGVLRGALVLAAACCVQASRLEARAPDTLP